MIETERLQLILGTEEHFQAALKNEKSLLEILDVTAAKQWNSFPEAVPFGYQMLKNNPQNAKWGMHFFVHKADKKLIGIGGYKGFPGEDGVAEIGYEISPEYQRKGLATEAAQAMIASAFKHEFVKNVDAHTLAEENPSTGVLRKCGMKKIAEMNDTEDGDIWQWRISREEFQNLIEESDK